MYKLLALDMDGTLLKKDKTISKRTKDAIKKAKNNGIQVVLATGRPTKGIEKYLKELDLVNDNDYAVSFNGAVIQNTKTGLVIAETPMSYEDLFYLFKLSQELNINIHALTSDSCITPKWNRFSQQEASLNEISLVISDFDKLDQTKPIVKIMFIDEVDTLNKALEALPEEAKTKFSTMRSDPNYYEFLNIKVNKGAGIEMLANILGIKQSEVICIGDAGNDIHMIKYAGLGVAMGNAFSDVKTIADYITRSNEEDGVAHVIEKFILAC